MKLIEANSSTIKEFGYDNNLHRLYVNFHNGREYVYADVPVNVYEAMVNADSKGKFLNANIIGRYNYVRIK